MKKNTFYFGADGQFGTLTAVGGTMGFYAGNVNIEAFYMKGFGKETVYWNSTGNDTEGAAHWAEEELEVKTVAGGKFGYGFILGTRFRVTPPNRLHLCGRVGEQRDFGVCLIGYGWGAP